MRFVLYRGIWTEIWLCFPLLAIARREYYRHLCHPPRCNDP